MIIALIQPKNYINITKLYLKFNLFKRLSTNRYVFNFGMSAFFLTSEM